MRFIFFLQLVFCCVAAAVNAAAPVLLDSHNLFQVTSPSYNLQIPYPRAQTNYFPPSPVHTRVFTDASGGAFVVISDPVTHYPYSGNLVPAIPPVSLLQGRYPGYPAGILNAFDQPEFRSGGSLLDGFQTPVGISSTGNPTSHVLHGGPQNLHQGFSIGGIHQGGSFPVGNEGLQGPAAGRTGGFPSGPSGAPRRGPGFPGGSEGLGAFPQGHGGSSFPVSSERPGAFPHGPGGSGGFPGGPQISAPGAFAEGPGGLGFPGGLEGPGAFPRRQGGAEGKHGDFPRGPSGPGGFPGTPGAPGSHGPSPGARSGPGGFHPPQGAGARSGDYGQPPSGPHGEHGGRPHGPPGPQRQ